MMHKAWRSIEEVPYCFSRSSIKFHGHTGGKIDNLNPIWDNLAGRSYQIPQICLVFTEAMTPICLFLLAYTRHRKERQINTFPDILNNTLTPHLTHVFKTGVQQAFIWSWHSELLKKFYGLCATCQSPVAKSNICFNGNYPRCLQLNPFCVAIEFSPQTR